MVRLVFRPYTQFRRSICTSESLRTSIRVSPDFVLTRHSSPSFGSQRVRSWCASSRNENETPGNAGRSEGSTVFLCSRETNFYFHYAFRFSVIPMTRAHARLLGPCFKTGPEITQSYSVADRRFEEVCPRTPRRTAATGRDRHQVRSSTRRTSLPRAGRELKSRPPPSVNRRASRSDNRVSESDGEPRSRATLRTVDRHPTDRDVLLGRSARVRNRLVTRRAQATRTSPVTPTRHSDDSVRD
ncbi:hypothetical protein HHI36_023800 [Cryptolaemus montrouzieri]|uniref:Uncharacterized protein n=1 Tax=Cryptolaemus montrouzieri TaxID=559131 RepID=A0ABD2PHM8_9CUCU